MDATHSVSYTPLFECGNCGDSTVLPDEFADHSTVELDCPSCGHGTLTNVDELCRVGRTVSPHKPACYTEWGERWPDDESPQLASGAVRLCPEHHGQFESPSLPDGAVGRCEESDCTHAVFEEGGDGALVCEACS